jgi:hypothetical protein
MMSYSGLDNLTVIARERSPDGAKRNPGPPSAFIPGCRFAPGYEFGALGENARVTTKQKAVAIGKPAAGQCLCGRVCFEIDIPARWAWHDHSLSSRRAHGAAYATYVGSWRKRFRITRGNAGITRFEDKAAKTVRSFCARCGTPLFYERARSPHMVNIPRALFSGRTGRQPLYHIAIEELQEWAYTGEPLVPLKGFPGVVWQRSKKKKRIDHDGLF